MNNKLELRNTLQNLLSSMSNDYYLDYYIEDFKSASWANLSNKQKIITDTIKKYKEHHEDFEEERTKPLMDYFQKITKNDKVIHFEEKFIYKELYKILLIIHSTFNAQELLNDSKAYPIGFAKIQSDLKKVELFKKHNKKNIVGDFRLHKSYIGQSRFRNWFAILYIKNKALAKFFTHLFLTADLVRVKEFHEDEEVSKKVLEELEFILMQQTTISKVIKSFGILIYWEMIKYLGVHKNDAEVYTKAMIYELFKENFNAEELHKVVEIKSSLGFFPIFGASKKTSLKDDEKQFIHNKIFNQIQKNTSITTEEFEPLFDSYIRTPHIQFLGKYPVELFRQNPKYSSIN